MIYSDNNYKIIKISTLYIILSILFIISFIPSQFDHTHYLFINIISIITYYWYITFNHYKISLIFIFLLSIINDAMMGFYIGVTSLTLGIAIIMIQKIINQKQTTLYSISNLATSIPKNISFYIIFIIIIEILNWLLLLIIYQYKFSFNIFLNETILSIIIYPLFMLLFSQLSNCLKLYKFTNSE